MYVFTMISIGKKKDMIEPVGREREVSLVIRMLKFKIQTLYLL